MPATLDLPVAKEKRDDAAVKIARPIYRQAKVNAAILDIPLAEYLSRILAKPVAADYKRLRRDSDADESPEDD